MKTNHKTINMLKNVARIKNQRKDNIYLVCNDTFYEIDIVKLELKASPYVSLELMNFYKLSNEIQTEGKYQNAKLGFYVE